MAVIGLRTLAVVVPALDAAARRGADHQRAGELTPGAVAQLGGLTGELIETGADVVGKLDLGYRAQPTHRHAHRRPHDGPLGERRIEDPAFSKLGPEARRRQKNPATRAHVFPEHQHAGVTAQLPAHALVDGLNERHGHGGGRPGFRLDALPCRWLHAIGPFLLGGGHPPSCPCMACPVCSWRSAS